MAQQKLSYPDAIRIVGTGLISTGVGLLVFVGITITWGDPFTHAAEAREQSALAQQFKASKTEFSESSEGLQPATLDPRVTRVVARRYQRAIKPGSVAGLLRIPQIHVRKYVVKGAGVEDLKRGPGLYRETSFPGSGLPVAIAGHRTTHGAPFLNIDKLRLGAKLYLDVPYGRFTYVVTRKEVILPNDWSIINVGAWERTSALRNRDVRSRQCPLNNCEHLVLTACHPKYSASHRLAIFARLTNVQLRSSRKLRLGSN